MQRPATIALAILGALVLSLAPIAQALPRPAFYFLKDDPAALPIAPPVPLPFGDGLLDPYNATTQNAPNATDPKQRLVLPYVESLLPVQFLTPAGEKHPDRIRGPLFIGVWTGPAVVLNGNLTATLFEVTATGDAIAIANGTTALDFNASKVPDPLTLVPPNTTDPQAIVFYEVAQVLPLVLKPPLLLIFPGIDRPFANESRLGISFRIEGGSSPLPVPVALFATVQYDAALSPSFVYVPWYEKDKPRPTPTRSATMSGSSTFSKSLTTTPTSDNDKDKGSPGPEMFFLTAGLLAAALIAARRRT